MISSHVLKARKNSAVSPNTQECNHPLQNTRSELRAITKDPGVPKNEWEKSSPGKVQVFGEAGRQGRDGVNTWPWEVWFFTPHSVPTALCW